MAARIARAVTFIGLAQALFGPERCSAHSLLQKEPSSEMLTYLSACPDPGFICSKPTVIPVPSRTSECQPFEPLISHSMGSFLVTWGDSPSLPNGTSVAVCTSFHLWMQQHCMGPNLPVNMPASSSLLRYLDPSEAEEGEPLKLGTLGPFRNRFPVKSISCAKLTSWQIVSSAVVEEGVKEVATTVALMEDKLTGHKFSLNIGLLLGTVIAMALFAVFGVGFAYVFKDSLSDLVVEDVEDPQAAAEAVDSATQKEFWFDPSCTNWDDAKTSTCKQQGGDFAPARTTPFPAFWGMNPLSWASFSAQELERFRSYSEQGSETGDSVHPTSH